MNLDSMKDILAAGKKPMNVAGAEGSYANAIEVVDCKAPEQADRKLEIMDASEDGAIEKFASEHTAAEFAEAMAKIGIPCSVVMNYEMMENHPHYLARNTWVEWETVDGKTVKGVTAVPRWTNNPTQIWRGCPSQGMDNDDILSDLGFSEEDIAALYEKKVLRKSDYIGGL